MTKWEDKGQIICLQMSKILANIFNMLSIPWKLEYCQNIDFWELDIIVGP